MEGAFSGLGDGERTGNGGPAGKRNRGGGVRWILTSMACATFLRVDIIEGSCKGQPTWPLKTATYFNFRTAWDVVSRRRGGCRSAGRNARQT